MDVKLWVALFAAVGSLLVAIVSLTTAILTGRSAARSSQDLETLKHGLRRANDAARISNSEFVKSVEGVRLALQAIQVVKDELLLVSSSTPDALDPDEARNRLQAAKQRLFEIYQSQHPLLSTEEVQALHRVKNLVVTIEHQTSESPEELRAIRLELSDQQAVLRDSLTQRLLTQTFASTA